MYNGRKLEKYLRSILGNSDDWLFFKKILSLSARNKKSLNMVVKNKVMINEPITHTLSTNIKKEFF